MRKIFTGFAVLAVVFSSTTDAFAGNKDRIGQAGATELLINPWGRSTGLFGMNTSFVKGLDAMKTNIAGLSFVEQTEVGVSHSMYLSGSGIGINNLGFAQKVGKLGVIGANIMAMSFGEIDITDYNNPEGGVGTYTPQFFNVQVGFAKEFSNSIHAGVGATFVSEQISNVKASGSVFEAGIQYRTGKRNNFHFGLTLRNIGTGMRFSGSGFSINSEAQYDATYSLNRQTPTETFEMPTYLNIGVSYDFYLDENKGVKPEDEQSAEGFTPQHRATVLGNFTSNSFNNDYLGAGVEYAFKEMFMVRAAYRYESKIGNKDLSTTFYTGLSAGATVQYKVNETGPTLALDYSFRPTRRPANGVHVITLRLMR
ncbi:MAG: PorV/PorQ family protein [Chitinophagales bacterium]|nr:PorV/PorQ family protein [Chitinophagaceae bacterium]MCB9065538.1 PorV/PorQ family protein [Chitinophagales bacterium]